MKIFGRRSKNMIEKKTEPQEPRLSGMTEPHYSKAASGAFIDVIMAAADAERPGRLGAAHDSVLDRTNKLDQAIEEASKYCNDELLSRMNAFRDAVVEWTMSESTVGELKAARENFTLGCRIALGAND